MITYPGKAERELAAALMKMLDSDHGGALSWNGVDLRPSAEHILYGALRRREDDPGSRPRMAWLPLARLAMAKLSAVGNAGSHRQSPILVMVTHPVHAELFAPVARRLGHAPAALTVDADTRRASGGRIPSASCRLIQHLPFRHLPSLAVHAQIVRGRLAKVPRQWQEAVGTSDGTRLIQILRRGLPLAALDAARIDGMLEVHQPQVVACFSESGLLGRIVPATAAMRGIRVVDLPHAEAADPWGTTGCGYDAVAVYGPLAASVMRIAGVRDDRIVQIGPLHYDALLTADITAPSEAPRMVLFASQPADLSKPALHPDVKRATLRAAVAATQALAPAELVVVPHPTERDSIARGVVAQALTDGVSARIESPGRLHDLLPGAWLLVTGSSQSVYEAVVTGVPALTANLTGGHDPVTFAADGIALGARSADEAAAIAAQLRGRDARALAAGAARQSLGGRLGPLDGMAAERAAEWLRSLVSSAEAADGH